MRTGEHRQMIIGECDFCHNKILNVRKNQKYHSHCGQVNKEYQIALNFILVRGQELDTRRKWELIRAMVGNV